jgi:hypothetical protein
MAILHYNQKSTRKIYIFNKQKELNKLQIESEIVKFARTFGLNPHILSLNLNLPINRIMKIVNEIILKYNLFLFPIIHSSEFGLNKAIIWCEKSLVKYENAKKLIGPLGNIFRGDIEDRKFMLIFYVNTDYFEIYKTKLQDVFSKLNMPCDIHFITEIDRFINKETCYDFSQNKWICNEKIVKKEKIPRKNTLFSLDKGDVDLITNLQINPQIPYWKSIHYRHIKRVLKGFVYTLGNTNYIINIRYNEPAQIIDNPYLLSAIRLDNGEVIAEYHMDLNGLKELKGKLKNHRVIISVRDLHFAHGFSLPYEVFKDNKWVLPKIEIE